MENSKQNWVGFNLVKGIGPARLRALLEYFGDIDSAWHATRRQLEACGLQEKLIDALEQTRQAGVLQKTWEAIENQDIQVLTWDDQDYPDRLREIDQSPPVLYVRGQLSQEDFPSIAIVGTRRITQYGRQVARELASELARTGFTVVSGLARGVDAVAHEAALEAGGRSIAVLGSGVDVIYPPENRRLAEQMIANGAVVSDYPPGTQPEAMNFPPRNRIISALAHAVVVVEAGEKSGALITAAFAADQGREVFAVPGYLYAPSSLGPNRLIQQGAHIFLGVQDLLATMNFGEFAQRVKSRTVLPADATEATLFALLGHEPLHIDELRAQSGMAVETVSAALTMMELKGLVRQVGSMRYVAVFEPGAEYKV